MQSQCPSCERHVSDCTCDTSIVDVEEPAIEPAISRAATIPLQGKIRVEFDPTTTDGVAAFAELIAKLARIGKPIEITIKVLDG